MNFKDLNTEKEKNEFETLWNSSLWHNKNEKPMVGLACVLKGHWFTSGNRVIEGKFHYDEDEGWNDEVSNSFTIDGWMYSEDYDNLKK
ncbi:MAG: hypothetical protein MJZ34_05335 [Paludibacteraceae bacterium]|nr:hypothetical protein [Paludibacteraceae bacterium]